MRPAPGQYAALAVLSADDLGVPDDEIAGIKSLLTITGGIPRHGAGSFAGLAADLPPIEPA